MRVERCANANANVSWQVGEWGVDVLLVPLRGGPEDALRGLRPAAGPVRGTLPGSEGPGLPKPEAQTRPGLQPLRLRPPVGAGALGTGRGGAQPGPGASRTRTGRTRVSVDPQCSRSCGGGVQTRPVVCRQRVADGSNPELPASSCPAPSPPSQQGCGQQACPAHWVPAGWSQVSSLPRNQNSPPVCRL